MNLSVTSTPYLKLIRASNDSNGARKPLEKVAGAESGSSKKYKKSPLPKLRAQKILKRLDACMKEELLFVDASLSLRKLCEKSHVRLHDASQALNQIRGVTYYEYVNKYRVIHAAKLMVDSVGVNVVDIAMAVGFNAKSTFYNSFKKFYGVTPKKYIETNGLSGLRISERTTR